MHAGDAPCKSASTALPPHGYRFAWWKYRSAPASAVPTANPLLIALTDAPYAAHLGVQVHHPQTGQLADAQTRGI